MPPVTLFAPSASYRAMLTDVLPYELPPRADPVGFYSFLKDANARVEGSEIVLTLPGAGLQPLIRMALGWPGLSIKCTRKHAKSHQYAVELGDLNKPTKPLHYTIYHPEKSGRRLSYPHHAAHLTSALFLQKWRDTILYHCRRSNFSLRRPEKVESYRRTESDAAAVLKAALRGVAVLGRDDLYFRSFFSYQKYRNINSFFESREMFQLERSYPVLVRLDVARCFDSVYTHSIEWAIDGRQVAKVNASKRKLSGFGNEFDQLMQRMNSNETHGILVGPEVSRIFAEIILQRVDIELEKCLEDELIVASKNYEIRRYVDDYFVYADSESTADTIESRLIATLRTFNMDVNHAKTARIATPWTSKVWSAKRAIETDIQTKSRIAKRADSEAWSFGSSAPELIRCYRSYCDVDFGHNRGLDGYALSLALNSLRKVDQVAGDSKSSRKQDGLESSVIEAVRALVAFGFYVVASAPSYSNVIKVLTIAALGRSIVRIHTKSVVARSSFDDLLVDALAGFLKRFPITRGREVEMLAALPLIKELPAQVVRDSGLLGPIRVLCQGDLPGWVNPIVVSELIEFCIGDPSLSNEADVLREWAEKLWGIAMTDVERSAELPLLALLITRSPLFGEAIKKEVWAHFQMGMEPQWKNGSKLAASSPLMQPPSPSYLQSMLLKVGGAVY